MNSNLCSLVGARHLILVELQTFVFIEIEYLYVQYLYVILSLIICTCNICMSTLLFFFINNARSHACMH
jgi:hypothetical protein